MTQPQALAVWQQLQQHQQQLAQQHMRTWFAEDETRFPRLSCECGDLLLDYSKNRITDETLLLLLQLAADCGVEQRRDAMFRGETLNTTEKRAVLHTALRQPRGAQVYVNGENVVPQVHAVLEQMEAFVNKVHSGAWLGYTGKAITDIVHIGIGGSDLGPRMVVKALAPYYGRDGVRVHFAANVDGNDMHHVLTTLHPETTLFIVASKSFTTQETLTNAHTARRWLVEALASDKAVAHHFVALSTNTQAVQEFGIDAEHMFVFWDWVGGRFSLWSAIGLPIALALGMDHFRALLAGAFAMDNHFREAPPALNMPLILGLLGIWYRNFCGTSSYAVLPYDENLQYLPRYLQQAEMESNGKRVTHDGATVAGATAPVVWGEPGTNGQHAFFQLLHQGTDLIPCDFLAPAIPQHGYSEHHRILLANFLAQPQALMQGKTEAEVQAELTAKGVPAEEVTRQLPHRVFPGNRPSNTLLFSRLTPEMLGRIIALYEHKIFVQGAVWNINSFDQWGVELGKQLAKKLLPELKGEKDPGPHDASTQGLLQRCRQWWPDGGA